MVRSSGSGDAERQPQSPDLERLLADLELNGAFSIANPALRAAPCMPDCPYRDQARRELKARISRRVRWMVNSVTFTPVEVVRIHDRADRTKAFADPGSGSGTRAVVGLQSSAKPSQSGFFAVESNWSVVLNGSYLPWAATRAVFASSLAVCFSVSGLKVLTALRV
jgi:hypothetical protein